MSSRWPWYKKLLFFVLPKWKFVALFHQLVTGPFLSLFLTINRSFSSKTSQLGQGSAPSIIQHCQNKTGKKICCDPWNQQLSSSKSRRFRPLKTQTNSPQTAEEQFVESLFGGACQQPLMRGKMLVSPSELFLPFISQTKERSDY